MQAEFIAQRPIGNDLLAAALDRQLGNQEPIVQLGSLGK